MRVAILSDIHGNLTAFEAVLADLRLTSPDLILHGGDLSDGGSGPVEIVDQIRDFGWQGVQGNTDEMLWRPESLEEFASRTPQLKPLWSAIGEMASVTREALGEERLAWLSDLPQVYKYHSIALVHASPDSLWRSPMHTASDEELLTVYSPLGRSLVIYGHIHRPYLHKCQKHILVANSGSVGRPYDGDPRASYLLFDDGHLEIKRVEYDVEREIKSLLDSGFPHADWIARMTRTGSYQAP